MAIPAEEQRKRDRERKREKRKNPEFRKLANARTARWRAANPLTPKQRDEKNARRRERYASDEVYREQCKAAMARWLAKPEAKLAAAAYYKAHAKARQADPVKRARKNAQTGMSRARLGGHINVEISVT